MFVLRQSWAALRALLVLTVVLGIAYLSGLGRDCQRIRVPYLGDYGEYCDRIAAHGRRAHR